MVVPLGDEEVQQLSLVVKDVDGSAVTRGIMPVRFTRLETM
jgi:protein-L-isoaspartate O-methyltransferase